MRSKSKNSPPPCGSASSTTSRLVETLWNFVPAFQRWGEGRTAHRGISPQRTRILALLHRDGPQIMSRLKTELDVTATNITALVDALEKDGFVIRKAHPDDRRATIVEITPKAACELAQGCSAYRDKVGELFADLTEKDRKELLKLLSLLQKKLTDSGCSRG